MLNWLLKKTRDPVDQIDKAGYEKLSQSSSASVVYHGDFSTAEGASSLSQMALADDYNSNNILIKHIIGELNLESRLEQLS